MKLFYSGKCLEYRQYGHPESPERVATAAEFLGKNGFSFQEPEPCTLLDILRVHSESLLESVQRGTFIDTDTPALPNMADYAMLSAGAAVQACDSAEKGETAFSLMRPPGHHATRNRVMGFCYFNSIAVAAARHLSGHPEARIAILDIDCHHGNGTEDIFLGNPSVLYISLHQSPLYPGTGQESKGNCLNFTFPPRTGEPEYLKILDTASAEIARFNPSLLGVSAGFDTFKGDPITRAGLEITTYRKIGKAVSNLKRPTFTVLEGGYSPQLPECIWEFLQGLT